MTRSAQISVTVSDDLLDALDVEAFRSDEPRAATARRILAEYLREAGIMSKRSPACYREGKNNYLYRPKNP